MQINNYTRNQEQMKEFNSIKTTLLNQILLLSYLVLVSFKDSYSSAMGNPELFVIMVSIM
jgi:hypothetical protein